MSSSPSSAPQTTPPALSPKRVPAQVFDMKQFATGRDLVAFMFGAVKAHQGYYQAGFLHGNLRMETVVILETDEGPEGALLDFDKVRRIPLDAQMQELFLRAQHEVYNAELRGEGESKRNVRPRSGGIRARA